MNIPQWIMAFLLVLGMINAVIKHGEIEIRKYDGAKSILTTLVTVSLLAWGGYFDCWLR